MQTNFSNIIWDDYISNQDYLKMFSPQVDEGLWEIIENLYNHNHQDDLYEILCKNPLTFELPDEKLKEKVQEGINTENEQYFENTFETNLLQNKQGSSEKTRIDVLVVSGINSTSTSNQRISNEEILKEFDKQAHKFKYLLRHTNFEDGYSNEAIVFFNKLYNQEPSISILWLNGFYAQNQNDPLVIEGILRILAFVDISKYNKYLIPIVKASFNDKSPAVQEAAIMVAENWRNQACLDALKSTLFASEYLKEYSGKVIKELQGELDR